MTYCVAASVAEGIVFASDSRTNAGIDHISTFGKMNIFETPGERVVVILTSGNLGTTQSVMSMLRQRSKKSADVVPTGILGVATMFDVATLVGDTLREVVTRDGPVLAQQSIDPNCNFIVGGEIAGEPPRLFHVYPQGNFIEATRDTPYFQIGETKYGKPIIDRVVKEATPIREVAKCLLVSFDSTMRSNLSVGLPIDLLAYEARSLKTALRHRFTEGDDYFRNLSQIWSAGLRKAFAEVPDVRWD